MQAGTLITFSSGAYSDYGYCGLIVLTQHCDLKLLGKRYVASYKHRYEGDKPYPEDFPSWLVCNGYGFEVDTNEIHLGEYGDFNMSIEEGK